MEASTATLRDPTEASRSVSSSLSRAPPTSASFQDDIRQHRYGPHVAAPTSTADAATLASQLRTARQFSSCLTLPVSLRRGGCRIDFSDPAIWLGRLTNFLPTNQATMARAKSSVKTERAGTVMANRPGQLFHSRASCPLLVGTPTWREPVRPTRRANTGNRPPSAFMPACDRSQLHAHERLPVTCSEVQASP